MVPNESISEERQAQAALYALGALTQHEARAYESYLAEAAPAGAAEFEAFVAVVNALGYDAPEAEPPAALRERLLASLAATTQPGARQAENAFTALRYHELDWQKLAPGLWAKELFKDLTTRTVSTLYKLDPGTVVGTHTHPGVEQCFIMQGDFIVNGESFGPGDFHCAMPQSVHETITTTQGTVLLVVAPYDYAVSG